ncbi:MAG: hypothetical protein HXY34_08180 [Candidatus Thorarchaeota archaeon]|nr:hypothetical protein [Candidatus Thorarchaeota archaeon]
MNNLTAAEYAIKSLPAVLRDRDVFHDKYGRVFVTLGHIQPSDRVLSILKYIPHSAGKWRKGASCYQRVFWGGVASFVSGLTELPPQYITYDHHFGTRLPEVPRSEIAFYFSPEDRLKEIIDSGPKDILEERAASLSHELNTHLGLPYSRLGVTGSVLWKAHDPLFSDLNMNVYGLEASWALQKGYQTLEKASDSITLRRDEDWAATAARMLNRSPELTNTDIHRLLERRTGIHLNGHCVGITPVLLPDEAPILHGAERYTTLGHEPVTTVVKIIDDRFGLFTPSIYPCTTDSTDPRNGVSRLIIYEGAFRGLLRSGDVVQVKGMLQSVVPQDGIREPFTQVMIGSMNGAGSEYMRLL